MSTNPTVTPVPLPAPLRILDDAEYDQAVTAAREAGRRDNVGTVTAEDMASAALIAVGLFPPPDTEQLDTDCCTAQLLPWESEAVDVNSLGVWQQCGDEPGHDGDDHDNGEFSWSDGQPGTVPALPGTKA